MPDPQPIRWERRIKYPFAPPWEDFVPLSEAEAKVEEWRERFYGAVRNLQTENEAKCKAEAERDEARAEATEHFNLTGALQARLTRALIQRDEKGQEAQLQRVLKVEAERRVAELEAERDEALSRALNASADRDDVLAERDEAMEVVERLVAHRDRLVSERDEARERAEGRDAWAEKQQARIEQLEGAIAEHQESSRRGDRAELSKMIAADDKLYEALAFTPQPSEGDAG